MLVISIIILVATFTVPLFERVDFSDSFEKTLTTLINISGRDEDKVFIVALLLNIEILLLIGSATKLKTMCLFSSSFGCGFLTYFIILDNKLAGTGTLIIWIMFLCALIGSFAMEYKRRDTSAYYTPSEHFSPTYVPVKGTLPTKLYCPKCYNSIEPGKFECSNCGTRIK